MALSGCWTAPSASVRPAGEPRVVAGTIQAEGLSTYAKVESVDRADGILGLRVSGVTLYYGIGPRVRNLGSVHIGDEIRATIEEVLTVYVPQPGKQGRRPPDARVLVVDPSYRLLRVQYADGGTGTFKVGLHVPMTGIEAGDAVTIHPVEVVELRRFPIPMLAR